MSNDVSLTIELFPGGDEEQFEVQSPREIYFILRDIEKNSARAALYYDKRRQFILTSVIGVDEEGVWLDASQNHDENVQVAKSERCIFVSSHHQAKVQFEVDQLELTQLDNLEAFYLPLPDYLLRIQRRDYFRLFLPAGALKCIVPLGGDPPRQRELSVRDISRGGIALYCEENDPDLQPGKIIPGCRIRLDEDHELTVGIQVRYISVTRLQSGGGRGCAGCGFTDLDGKMGILLQRYITQQQKANLL